MTARDEPSTWHCESPAKAASKRMTIIADRAATNDTGECNLMAEYHDKTAAQVRLQLTEAFQQVDRGRHIKRDDASSCDVHLDHAQTHADAATAALPGVILTKPSTRSASGSLNWPSLATAWWDPHVVVERASRRLTRSGRSRPTPPLSCF